MDRAESGGWNAITSEVNEYGGALLPRLLTDAETAEFRSMHTRDELAGGSGPSSPTRPQRSRPAIAPAAAAFR